MRTIAKMTAVIDGEGHYIVFASANDETFWKFDGEWTELEPIPDDESEYFEDDGATKEQG